MGLPKILGKGVPILESTLGPPVYGNPPPPIRSFYTPSSNGTRNTSNEVPSDDMTDGVPPSASCLHVAFKSMPGTEA